MGGFVMTILKFQARVIRRLTVTTWLRPYSECLYPKFKDLDTGCLLWLCDYGHFWRVYAQDLPKLLSLTTWLRAILKRLYRKFRSQPLLILGDYATMGRFGTNILKFQALVLRLFTVTTWLRPYSERLYPKFKDLETGCLLWLRDYGRFWRVYAQDWPKLLDLTTWLRAILERVYWKFRSQPLLVWVTTRLRADLERLYWNFRLWW